MITDTALVIQNDTDNNTKDIRLEYQGQLDAFPDYIKNNFRPIITVDFSNYRGDKIVEFNKQKVYKLDVKSPSAGIIRNANVYVDVTYKF
jgi:hypothetical protein